MALVVFGGYFVAKGLILGGGVPLTAVAALVLGVLGCLLVRVEAGERAAGATGTGRPSLRLIRGGKGTLDHETRQRGTDRDGGQA